MLWSNRLPKLVGGTGGGNTTSGISQTASEIFLIILRPPKERYRTSLPCLGARIGPGEAHTPLLLIADHPYMKGKTNLEVGLVSGHEINLEGSHGGLLVEHKGKVQCLVGYRPPGTSEGGLPYFAPAASLRYQDARQHRRFVYLTRGTLHLEDYFSKDATYRVRSDRWISMPSGAITHFGVLDRSNRETDVELTRQVFGATFQDLSQAGTAWAAVFGYPSPFLVPRVTFSKTRDNDCELTGCLIPREFPYMAFERSQGMWGHVSLRGFYKLLSLACLGRTDSPAAKALLGAGLEHEVLEEIISSSQSIARPLAWGH